MVIEMIADCRAVARGRQVWNWRREVFWRREALRECCVRALSLAHQVHRVSDVRGFNEQFASGTFGLTFVSEWPAI
jgi:hypothetical protein